MLMVLAHLLSSRRPPLVTAICDTIQGLSFGRWSVRYVDMQQLIMKGEAAIRLVHRYNIQWPDLVKDSKTFLDILSKMMKLPDSWGYLPLSMHLRSVTTLVLCAVRSAKDKKLLLLLPEHIITDIVDELREV